MLEARVTPVDLLNILCIELHRMTPQFRLDNHAAIVKLWRDTRADALSFIMPPQLSTSGLGGDSHDKPRLVSTPEEIAAWCLELSRHIGVNRDFPKKAFYVPPPSLSDFTRLSLPTQSKSASPSTL